MAPQSSDKKSGPGGFGAGVIFRELGSKLGEAAKTTRYACWASKKMGQVLFRRHISHVLAFLLGIGIIVREWDIFVTQGPSWISWIFILNALACPMLLFVSVRDLAPSRRTLSLVFRAIDLALIGAIAFTLWFARARFRIALTDFGRVRFTTWLIMLLALGTIVACGWEFFGNKLSTSEQDVRFVYTVREMLVALEKFCYGADRLPDPNARLNEFIQSMVQVTANTFEGYDRACAGYMMREGKALKLTKISANAPYEPGLTIPLPDATAEPAKGAAGLAFAASQLVYVPFVKKEEAWPLRFSSGRYSLHLPAKAWIRSSKPEYGDFTSALCVPVARYHKTEADKVLREGYGVLNISSKSRDTFVDRDFMMAESFASIIALAMGSVQIEEQTRKIQEPAKTN